MTIAGMATHHLEQQTSPVPRGSYYGILAEISPEESTQRGARAA